jgi:hypothetical protein
MVFSLVDLFASTLAFYSISMNYNMSYQWHLLPGEHLVVVPSALGACFACSSYQYLAVTVHTGKDSKQNAPDDIVGVRLGGQWGQIDVVASREVTFFVHIRFVQYDASDEIRFIRHPERLPFNVTESSESSDPGDRSQSREISGSTRLSDDSGNASTLPIVSFSLAVAVIVVFLIIQNRRRENHRNYEEMDISDDEDLDTYIPAVVDRPRAPERKDDPVPESPYVVCVMNEGTVAQLPEGHVSQ